MSASVAPRRSSDGSWTRPASRSRAPRSTSARSSPTGARKPSWRPCSEPDRTAASSCICRPGSSSRALQFTYRARLGDPLAGGEQDPSTGRPCARLPDGLATCGRRGTEDLLPRPPALRADSQGRQAGDPRGARRQERLDRVQGRQERLPRTIPCLLPLQVPRSRPLPVQGRLRTRGRLSLRHGILGRDQRPRALRAGGSSPTPQITLAP